MTRLTPLLLAVCAQVVWCADLTTQYPGGTVTGSSSHANYPPAHAFDDKPATDMTGRWLANGSTGWVQYQFPGGQAFAVGSYTIWNHTMHSVAARAPRNFHLAGSNDGSSWTTLDSRTGQTGWTDAEARTYTLAAPSEAYEYYRLTITANNGDSQFTGLGELELFEPSTDPPALATAPSPADEAGGAIPAGMLRWTTGLHAASNRVYLGLAGTLDEEDFLGATAAAELAYGLLAGSTEYFWRVDGQNLYGTTTGSVWRFTTVALPPEHVAQDGFEDYVVGPLAGAGTAGAGWTAGWTATPAVEVVEASMTYANGDVRVDGGTRAVRYPHLTGDTRPLSRLFEPIGYGTAYFSMLVQGEGMQNDVHSFALRDSSLDGGEDGIAESAGFNFGRGLSETGTPFLTAEISYLYNSRTRVATPVAVENNQTYFVVARLRRAPGSGEYEFVDVLVNPDSATEPATGWTTAGNANCNAKSLQQFILRVAVMDAGDWILFDELRIGTTYEAVVPRAPPPLRTVITIQ